MRSLLDLYVFALLVSLPPTLAWGLLVALMFTPDHTFLPSAITFAIVSIMLLPPMLLALPLVWLLILKRVGIVNIEEEEE